MLLLFIHLFYFARSLFALLIYACAVYLVHTHLVRTHGSIHSSLTHFVELGESKHGSTAKPRMSRVQTEQGRALFMPRMIITAVITGTSITLVSISMAPVLELNFPPVVQDCSGRPSSVVWRSRLCLLPAKIKVTRAGVGDGSWRRCHSRRLDHARLSFCVARRAG